MNPPNTCKTGSLTPTRKGRTLQTRILRWPEGQECVSSLWRGSRALWTPRSRRTTLSSTCTLLAPSPPFPSEVCAFQSQNQARCLPDCSVFLPSNSHLLPQPEIKDGFCFLPRDRHPQQGRQNKLQHEDTGPLPTQPGLQTVFLGNCKGRGEKA